ncbi:hypothetical protein HNQ00_000331 [Flavobacterium sp. 14A]|nr:hypothetical protein [Flavobacterium sp. 14A]
MDMEDTVVGAIPLGIKMEIWSLLAIIPIQVEVQYHNMR